MTAFHRSGEPVFSTRGRTMAALVAIPDTIVISWEKKPIDARIYFANTTENSHITQSMSNKSKNKNNINKLFCVIVVAFLFLSTVAA